MVMYLGKEGKAAVALPGLSRQPEHDQQSATN
jgi:hypothetical protein